MEVEQQEEVAPTEDEYFEQELLDFLQIINTIHTNLSNHAPNHAEPKDEIGCIITRFNKTNCVMPSDQWTRVYGGLKQLSQLITTHSDAFESWSLLRDLFESAKTFKTKYPTAQSGQKPKKQTQKSMHQVLKFAKEFADDEAITHITHTKEDNKIKMTKYVKQSKIKQIIKKKPIPSKSQLQESLISNTNTTNTTKPVNAIPSNSSTYPVITNKTEKTKKPVPVKDEVTNKSPHSKSRHERDRERERFRDRDKGHRHRHRHRSRSRSRSRSRDRDHHRTDKSARHHHSYRSRSTSKTRDRPPPSSRSSRGAATTRSHSTHELDEWGLRPPIHTREYIEGMSLYQTKQRDMMMKTDMAIDDMEKIPVVYGDSEICHGFNEGRCRLDPCKYHHVCWSCKGRGHPSSLCPYKPTRPYDAPPNHHKPCVNWNISGCPGGCLCSDRHICLFCRGHHPMRHSPVCSWKFNREVQMNKRKPMDPNASVRDRQNLNPIGQYEHLRLKDEENGTFQDNAKPRMGYHNNNTHNNKIHKRMSMTPPPSMTIPTSFMAKSIQKDETVSITEVCVLYNTPSGCPAKYGKNDEHLHYAKNDNHKNPNTYDGVCQLKHRCRECFGRHSFFDCPFRYHGIKCFIVNDIVRYNEFPKRVYVVNGFIDRINYNRHSSSNFNMKRNNKQLHAPKLKITEVGLDMTAAQIEIAASTLSKIVSSVQMQFTYPKMMIKELPNTISSQQVENKLRLLFHEKGIANIVRIQCTASQSNWIISFLSVTDRENAFELLQHSSMQGRELKICLFDDDTDTANEETETEDGKVEEDKKTLKLITKDEVPVHEHLYYCTLCDIGLFEYGLLRQHLLSGAHVALVHRKGLHQKFAGNEKINLNECILCGTNVIHCTMSDHMASTTHDNSNILMMLSLVRCQVSTVYHCEVCNLNISNSREYFIHCNSDQHRSGLEDAIEPCPYFNKRGSGCQNDRCQFKHVCVGCNAVTPIYRCKRCKNNEVCNMFNKGGAGCWYARGSCHRRHICHYCHGTHPKVGCPKLYPKCKKRFNGQGQEIKPGNVVKGQMQSQGQSRPQPPPPPNQPPPPQSNYPQYYGGYAPPPPPYNRYVPQQPPPYPPQHNYPYAPQYPPQSRQ
eukprot:95340_1